MQPVTDSSWEAGMVPADASGANPSWRGVEQLESRYRSFPGLNLSLEVLEGQRHRADKDRGGPHPNLEVQIVDAADSIAYDAHDADDALELGLLQLPELIEVPLWSEAAARVTPELSDSTPLDLRRAVVHELIDWQVGDLLTQTRQRLAEQTIDSVAAVRAQRFRIAPSDGIQQRKSALETFLYERVYRHPTVVEKRIVFQESLRQMFLGYREHANWLPDRFRQLCETDGISRTVADYLAGMTDRFAMQEYQRLFSSRTS